MATLATPTPGDWAFTEGDPKTGGMSTIHKADDKEFIIGYVICESKQKNQRAEDIANARVMALAPKLLTMLHKIMFHADLAVSDEGVGGPMLDAQVSALLDLADGVAK